MFVYLVPQRGIYLGVAGVDTTHTYHKRPSASLVKGDNDSTKVTCEQVGRLRTVSDYMIVGLAFVILENKRYWGITEFTTEMYAETQVNRLCDRLQGKPLHHTGRVRSLQ